MSNPHSFKNVYGPWAVVTGASAGIGAEFARQLAAAGISVAVVARRADKLAALRDELTAAHGIQVRVIAADLVLDTGVQTLLEETADLDVGLLVNNAGVDLPGAFIKMEMEQHKQLIDLNISAFTSVAHGFARRFVKRNRDCEEGDTRRSGMLMMSSLLHSAAPFLATYGASKAFVSALTIALRAELAPERVDVMVLEPGVVVSEMSARAKQVVDFESMGFQTMPVEKCVHEALTAFEAGRVRHTPGLMNRIMSFITSLLPGNLSVNILEKQMKGGMQPQLMQYATS